MSRANFCGFVEFAPHFSPRSEISHVLFDFDGTLSLIRQGWPEVMLPLFLEVLPHLPGETEMEVKQLLYDDIMRLNGKQTIYQMIQLTERIKERGGVPQDPLWYKKEYLRRLDARIHSRIGGLKSRAASPDEHLVHGSRALLEELAGRDWKLYLASGTDESYVRAEAALLKIDHYFEGRIYGAKDEYRTFSKKMIIDCILRENNVPGSQLLAFGDGYVEIENTKEAGGLAVAVASDEANNGLGNVDPWKRQRLLGVGADVVIPDYRDALPLLREITGTTSFSNP
jgi:phosphoglycolate phosphatase